MKNLILLGYLITQAHAAEISGNIQNATNEAGLTALTQKYEVFLQNNFVSSDYCNTGWGDQPGTKVRMLRGCKRAQKTELSKILDASWVYGFALDSANTTADETHYRFEHFPRLGKRSPLECTFILEFTVNSNKELLQSDIELYCDH